MHQFNQGNLKVYRTGKCWFKFKGLGIFYGEEWGWGISLVEKPVIFGKD